MGDYKKREHLDSKIFTIDSKNTKCHDDALSITKISNEGSK
jgi:exoribonuclease R